VTPVPYRGRLVDKKERIVTAVIGYGTALLLLLLSLVVGDGGEARSYLFVAALIAAGATSGILLRSIGARRG
jgi:hypothetical protein